MIEFLTGFAFALLLSLAWIFDQHCTVNALRDKNFALKNQVCHLGMVIIDKDIEIFRLKEENAKRKLKINADTKPLSEALHYATESIADLGNALDKEEIKNDQV